MPMEHAHERTHIDSSVCPLRQCLQCPKHDPYGGVGLRREIPIDERMVLKREYALTEGLPPPSEWMGDTR